MNDDFRDPIDGAIAHDLDALASTDLDADATLGALRPALVRARARRRLAVASGALGAVVIVLGVGGLIAGSRSSHLDVQQRSTTVPVTPSTPTTPTTRAPGKGASTTTIPSRSTSTTSPPQGTTPTSPTTDDHGGTSTPGPGSTTKPPVTLAPKTTTYSSTGGSITVTFANGALTLDSHTAAPGFSTEVHKNDPDDVEVRFSNAGTEWRIRIRVENGQVTKEITEN